jgi:spermidine synthase
VRRAGQLTLFENGEPALSFPDPESAEVAAHLPLLAAPHVERVLVTAEALGGALGEVLKHPVAGVDCVVADPQAAALALPRLPGELAAAAADPRVHLRNADPRAWIAAHPGTYDAMLLGAVEPTSALADRLATREFFALARRALRPGGILTLTLSAPPNYLGPEVRLRNASIARALAAEFPRVEVLRAAPLTLLASDAPAPLADAARLGARLRERRIAVKTLSPEVIAALLEPERAAEAGRELRETPVRENRDAAPAAYLYHARFREAAADPAVAAWLAALDGPARWAVFALPLLAGALAVLPRRPTVSRLRPALGAAAAATGCTAMALQFLLLFVHQTARGLLYVALGVLSGVFMGGLAAGSALSVALHRRGIPPGASLRRVAGALVALPALAGATFAAILGTGSGTFAPAADLLAGAAAAGCGLATGAAFALLTLADPDRAAGTGGAYYALDLAGSAAGALLASLWLLPLLGLPVALAFLATLQAAAALVLWRAGAFAVR